MAGWVFNHGRQRAPPLSLYPLGARTRESRRAMEPNWTICNVSEEQASITDLDIEPGYCTVPEWVVVLQAFVLALLVLGTLVGNSFVLFLVARYKALRYRSIIVSLSVVVADLFLGIFYITPALISASAREWVLGGEKGCIGLGFLAFYFLYVRWMAMGLIAVDRFCYILFPITYIRCGKPFLIILTCAVWAGPFGMHFPSLVGYAKYSFRAGYSHCTLDCGSKAHQYCYIIFMTQFLVQLLIGLFVPGVLYVIMFCIGRAKRKHIRLGTMKDESGNYKRIAVPSKWSRRDINALFTFLFIFLALLLTNVPLYGLSILRRPVPALYRNVPLWGQWILVDLFYSSSMLDAVIVTRNEDFHRAIMQTFCKRKLQRKRSLTSSVSYVN